LSRKPKRALKYRREAGKCAESGAADFKIELYPLKFEKDNSILTEEEHIPRFPVLAASSLCKLSQLSLHFWGFFSGGPRKVI
jgi:hypothetical protein